MGSDDDGPPPPPPPVLQLLLFESVQAKGRVLYRLFSASIFLGICMVWAYRATQMPSYHHHHPPWAWGWAWMALFGAELWFGFYWILSQSLRWNTIYRRTFTDRLSARYGKSLPNVDIFVCTADPVIEPPIMVINTVLSLMAYDYPPEKLSVYLSDDGGSELTFFALLEASRFAKHWLPYCRKNNVEPRCPAAYFSSMPRIVDPTKADPLTSIRKLYEEMDNRIAAVVNLGHVTGDSRQHKGFSQWDSYHSRKDHDAILQILVDGRDPDAKDVEGCQLPTLVYMAREKRPQYSHNFKAGAMNALIRVSSMISNGPIILNVDCDMYSNNSKSVRDALCFFMDEKQSRQIAFVQFPQKYANVTKNDIYATSVNIIYEVEFHGLDGNGGPWYIGSGCFHRRDILCGRRFSEEDSGIYLKRQKEMKAEGSVEELEEKAKELASCTYELDSQWGKEVGLKYGIPVEDVITGLTIQCRGWKSVYMNPKRAAFLGVAPTTLAQTLVQQKRWSEGDFQILLTKFSPIWYGYKRISLGLQMGYCYFCLWACNCLATICYCTIPSLCLLKGIPLYPKISSIWFLPFAYIIMTAYGYNLAEHLWTQGTALGWWNAQRMWIYQRTSPYLFAFVETILKMIGVSEMEFIITPKVVDEDVSKRYEKEMMEFGGSTDPMFTILATIALVNLLCLTMTLTGVVIGKVMDEAMALQNLLCGVLVLINWPLYEALFVRKDTGKMPTSVTGKSIVFALFACSCFFIV